MIEDILDIVQRHDEWRGKKCINLIPSENVTSPQVRSLLSSEMAHRYTSPDHFYMGTRFIDEIEAHGQKIARELFKAESADLRPLSGHIADFIFLASFAKRNSSLICVSASDGGYPGIWKEGLPKVLGIKVHAFPFSKEKMNIKTDEAVEAIAAVNPSIVVFGASLFRFPHPVHDLAAVAKEMGAEVGFDGSHVLGLIAGGVFQHPLQEGAHALFGSTHKSFFGPQGGIMLADKEHGELMRRKTNPAFVDNAHWNRIAALTLALAEMRKFGAPYAKQVILNAQALGEALSDSGFPVAGAEIGYTESHQVLLDYGGYKKGRDIAARLEMANLIVDCGVRLGTCEVTRRGMKETEMARIAELIEQVVIKGREPSKVKHDVMQLASEFSEIEYCFQK